MLNFKLALTVKLMILSSFCFGQDLGVDSLFTIVYNPGENWIQNKPVYEQPYFVAHSEHLSRLRNEKKLIVGGRFSDKDFMILKVKNRKEAQAIIEIDSSVIYAIFNVDLFYFNTLYAGYVGKEIDKTHPDTLKVTGIGGVFFKSENPEKLKVWYKEHLGIGIGEHGTTFAWRKVDNPSEFGFTVWSAFNKTDDYFNADIQEYMINYRVQNLKGLLNGLRRKGVTIVGEIETYEYGIFAWILDIDGRKVELWQPNDTVYNKINIKRMNSN